MHFFLLVCHTKSHQFILRCYDCNKKKVKKFRGHGYFSMHCVSNSLHFLWVFGLHRIACVCVHMNMSVCTHTAVCMSGMDTRVTTGSRTNWKCALGLHSLFLSFPLSLSFFLPEKKTTFHSSYCRLYWNDLFFSGCCQPFFFSESVTQHTSCPAALLLPLFLLLPSPTLPPHSSSCPTSDLIRTSCWPLGLLFSCHLVSPALLPHSVEWGPSPPL